LGWRTDEEWKGKERSDEWKGEERTMSTRLSVIVVGDMLLSLRSSLPLKLILPLTLSACQYVPVTGVHSFCIVEYDDDDIISNGTSVGIVTDLAIPSRRRTLRLMTAPISNLLPIMMIY
jgi:hypothetical protein